MVSMADQRPWLKLWKSTYTDSDLAQLSLEDQARWFRLLLLVGLNGERGTMLLREHGRGLLGCFWTTLGARGTHRLKMNPAILARLPGVTYAEEHDGLRVTFTKWAKYQDDTSAERTRAWRHKRASGDATSPSPSDATTRHVVTEQEEKRRDTPLPPVGGVTPKPSPWPEHPEHLAKRLAAFEEGYRDSLATCPDLRAFCAEIVQAAETWPGR